MSGSLTHVLFEGPSGYALFTVDMQEEIGAKTKAMQDTINDINIFNRMVKLASFVPFTSAAQALENANDVSEGILNPHLKSMLNMIVPGSGKGNKKQSEVVLAVSERGLAGSIQGEMGIACDTSERSLELVRGIRLHQEKLLASGGMQKGDVSIAQLGLGHSYSRGKVKVGYVSAQGRNVDTTVQRQPIRQHDHPSHLPFRPARQGSQHLFHAMSRMVRMAFSRALQARSRRTPVRSARRLDR